MEDKRTVTDLLNEWGLNEAALDLHDYFNTIKDVLKLETSAANIDRFVASGTIKSGINKGKHVSMFLEINRARQILHVGIMDEYDGQPYNIDWYGGNDLELRGKGPEKIRYKVVKPNKTLDNMIDTFHKHMEGK